MAVLSGVRLSVESDWPQQGLYLSTNAESYKWDFGDNTTSSATNPVHIYTDTVSATYSIMLKAYSKSGEQWAIKSRSIYVVHKR